MPGPVERGRPLRSWSSGAVAALLLLAACAPAGPAAPSKPAAASQPAAAGQPAAQAPGGSATPSQIRLVYPQDITGMHPYANSSSPDYARWSQIYDTISQFDPEKVEYVPNLAESWSTPDPNTWEIKLKRDVKFHNGDPFTADDVLFSLDRIANDPQSQQTEKVKNVAEVVKVDDYTIQIKTKVPDAPLMSGLYNISILDKALYDRLGAEAADRLAVGTGPYMFKEWVPGQRLVLTRNPNYHGTPKPTIDEAIYRVIPEAEARTTALLNGEADVIFGVPPQHLERIRASGVADVRGSLEERPGFIAMNPNYKPWDDKRMRLAVSYAIDREAIVKGILNGEGQALFTPIGPGSIGYDPNVQPQYHYDPDRARQLVVEAGYPNGIDVELGCPLNRYIKDKDICEAFASMFTQVGIRTKPSTPEYATFFAAIRQGKQPFYMFSRGSVVDPSEYLHQYFQPGATKRLQFEDPKITELLTKELGTFDPTERLNVLHDLQVAIMEQAPMAFTYVYMLNYGVSKRVEWKARGDEYMPAAEMRLR